MVFCWSAYLWGMKWRSLGHELRLVPSACDKPFVKR